MPAGSTTIEAYPISALKTSRRAGRFSVGPTIDRQRRPNLSTSSLAAMQRHVKVTRHQRAPLARSGLPFQPCGAAGPGVAPAGTARGDEHGSAQRDQGKPKHSLRCRAGLTLSTVCPQFSPARESVPGGSILCILMEAGNAGKISHQTSGRQPAKTEQLRR